MSDDDCVENLAKAIVNCDTSTIGNLANQCIGLIDAETIHTLTEQIKANCSDSDALATILYYLDLCKQNVSETAVIKSIAPVVPGMSCFFDPQHAFSLVALLPGEFLTGFMDGLDENITSALLKRFLDSCVNNRYLQAVIRCTVLSLTDSVIGLGRLAVHMYTEYLFRGELDEELPYWHVYLWNTLAAHLIVNGMLFFSLEVMKAYNPENWKQQFSTQFLRMRIIPQILKLMLTYAWGGCRTKGFVGYLVNVIGQIAGHISISHLCLKRDVAADDYNIKEAVAGTLKKITERLEHQERRANQLQEQVDQQQEQINRLEHQERRANQLQEQVDQQQEQINQLLEQQQMPRNSFFGRRIRDSFSSGAWSNTEYSGNSFGCRNTGI